MLFNSAEYLFFLFVVVVVYYLLPHKGKPYWLLGVSWYFYMQWNPRYILLMLGTIVVTYTAGLLIERKRDKRVLLISLFLLITNLVVFKYLGFFAEIANAVFAILKNEHSFSILQMVLPVGISFFTLQSIGYVIDVWRGTCKAEHNFLYYALFISFFPQLVAGPIERVHHLLPQVRGGGTSLSWDNFRKSILLILYGLFCKMVIADRLAMFVDAVYGKPEIYRGWFIVFATGAFAFQIYCDFYGYSTIARGSALLLGVQLVDNFNAPYLASSIQDFWRRWHISLSYWFRDYVYIPLGGNRKGTVRKKANLLFVFSLSGLWHGASITFILWGFLNGLYQVTKDTFAGRAICSIGESLREKNKWRLFFANVLRRIAVFGMISFTWFFFRAGNLAEAIRLAGCVFPMGFDRRLLAQLPIGGDWRMTVPLLFICLCILFFVDWWKYRGIDVASRVIQSPWRVRAVWFVGLFVLNVLFGCYGETYETAQFIYFQF